ncbi:MAG TPA: hypothetical protein PLS70_19180 [Acidobacteriota bacterium]|nr:hypothetical protein [Acidobacteriota bacterium]
MPSSRSLILKPPLWACITFPITIVAGFHLLVVYPLFRLISNLDEVSNRTLAVHAVIICFGLWLIGNAGLRMWREVQFSAYLDADGIRVITWRELASFAWSDVIRCELRTQSKFGESGVWITLVGHDNQVLAQWNRNWYRYTRSSLTQFDTFTSQIWAFLGQNEQAQSTIQAEPLPQSE